MPSTEITTTPCQLWQGETLCGVAVLRHGYWFALAQRVLWEAHHGPLDAGLIIRARCQNLRCVNLQHLYPDQQEGSQRVPRKFIAGLSSAARKQYEKAQRNQSDRLRRKDRKLKSAPSPCKKEVPAPQSPEEANDNLTEDENIP